MNLYRAHKLKDENIARLEKDLTEKVNTDHARVRYLLHINDKIENIHNTRKIRCNNIFREYL